MPSAARKNFEKYPLRDVKMLRDMHRDQHVGRGRPYSVLTRSGVFLLCASWELYCEEVIAESVDWILQSVETPMKLPQNVRLTLSKALKEDKHELAPLKLAGKGWRRYFEQYADNALNALNTPNSSNVISLFGNLTGIDVSPVLNPISVDLKKFIKKRGDIAHQGAQAGHVSINDLDADYGLICKTVVELDNFLVLPMREIMGYQPWNRQK